MKKKKPMQLSAAPEEHKEGEVQDHEVQMALQDFARVEGHKKNDKLMSRVRELADAQKSSVDQVPAKSLKDLRKKAAEMEE